MNEIAPAAPGEVSAIGHDGPVSKFAAVRSAIPTLLILAALGGVAFWGHYTGWTLPSFEQLFSGTVETEADWCEAHKVPLSICAECNQEEFPRPPHYAWDEDYGVPDNPLRHPDIAQVNGEPQLPKYDTLAALKVMDRQPNDSKCGLHLLRLQFADEATAEKMGIEFEAVSERPMEDHVIAISEVIYEPTAVARLSSPVGGKVWQVRTKLGEKVSAGDVLALIDSPDIADAKANYIEAVIALQMTEEEYQTLLQASETVNVGRMALVEAKSARDGAKSRMTRTVQLLANLGLDVPASTSGTDPDALNDEMRFLGIPDALRDELRKTTSTSSLYPLTAPQAGTVIELGLATGEVIDTREVLGVVANRERMLISMRVTVEQSRYVRMGLPVRFVSDVGDKMLDGVVTWISASVDDISRQLEARATITTVPDDLRANSFGTSYIILRQEPNAVVVPRGAMQWDGSCNMVFVRDKNFRKPDQPKVIHPRKVRPGASDAEFVEILAGVLPGEVVVSTGVGILRAQLLANKLGAG